MWSSPLFWIVIAIALFWALGAYNRLMRLRSAVVQSFGSFDAHMVRLLALLGEFHAFCTVQREASAAASPVDQEIAALHGAATQLSASLAVARARPLRSDAMAALAAARDVLHASWPGALHKAQETATPAEAIGQAGEGKGEGEATPAEPVPPGLLWTARWSDHVQQNEQAIAVFNDAVVQYNAAIAQFPANLLAWAFGFKTARGL
ncbi:LemA family protein [Acidovorax sp. sic0104]|uniref:LemA family protein n=1 Tax=Acidovorax sp. sic0104 TaxID=2854784 RepID=UPI001C44B9D4|nr:LemA family protein [Acidovorax sp. sic0104]MBV7542437.1 LemA family protein [Acidovorax sp. sic0104]